MKQKYWENSEIYGRVLVPQFFHLPFPVGFLLRKLRTLGQAHMGKRTSHVITAQVPAPANARLC